MGARQVGRIPGKSIVMIMIIIIFVVSVIIMFSSSKLKCFFVSFALTFWRFYAQVHVDVLVKAVGLLRCAVGSHCPEVGILRCDASRGSDFFVAQLVFGKRCFLKLH